MTQQHTAGVFMVTVDGLDIYVGASSQIEIAFRDYMGWIKKGKAPIAIQDEADRFMDDGLEADETIDHFDYRVLVEEDDPQRRISIRRNYKADGRNATPAASPASLITEHKPQPKPEPEPEELTTQERNRRIKAKLDAGERVKDVAEEFGVSKSTVYNVKNSR